MKRRHTARMAIASILLVCFFSTATFVSASEGDISATQVYADGRALTKERLTHGDWRLYTMTLSVMPPEGYPIRFGDDGTVEHRNLSGLRSWTVADDGKVRLRNEAGNVVYVFTYDRANGVLYHMIERGSFEGNWILIAPAGFDFGSYRPVAAA
jgi:hypothetical protein